MTFRYLKKYHLLKLAREDRHYVNNTESLMDLIEDGHGYGVLEESFLDQFIKRDKIAVLNNGLAIENKMALCWVPRPVMPKLFRDLIKSIE